MGPLRWGIAGCGRISIDYMNAVRILPESEHQFAACAARDLTRAEKFAKDHAIQKFYGSYQDMANDPDIDIIYIGTVHTTHSELCCLFMNAGKRVLCEKPLAMNLKQVQRCVDAAKKNNVFFMEAIWSRFFPVYKKLQEELKKSAIGEVRHISVNFGFHDLIKVDRIADKNVGGGVLMDIGLYTLQLALFVYGEEPQKVESAGSLNEDGVDWFQNVTLTFSENRTAQLTSHGTVLLQNNAVVFGTEGMIEIPSFMWCPTEIVVKGEKHEFPLPGEKAQFASEHHVRSAGLAYEAQAIREAILKGQKEHLLMSHEESLRLARLLEKLRQQLGIKYDCDE